MSLFDVIKYPLSIPVTLEEARALPEDVLNRWLLHWNRLPFDQKFNLDDKYARDVILNYLLEYEDTDESI